MNPTENAHGIGTSPRTAFFAGDMIQSAVIGQREVIGDAVKNLSVTVRPMHPGGGGARYCVT